MDPQDAEELEEAILDDDGNELDPLGLGDDPFEEQDLSDDDEF
jgi:hypothetical protein